MDEVAEGYLTELVNRSLIQIVHKLFDGTPILFRIHDLLREYIISKSRHASFIANVSGNVRWTGKILRIALDASSKNIPRSYSFDHLRSLMWFGGHDSSCVVNLQKVLDRRRRLLKVLDLGRAPLETFPREVFKLYHLKFLSLRESKVKLIPKSIKNLVHLEILDLSGTRVTQLPTEVVKLKKLRHLLVGSIIYENNYLLFVLEQGFHGPFDIGRLSSLQILLSLKANEVDGVKTVVEIGKLTQLRTLGLTNIKRKDGKDLCSSISKLDNLRDLYLSSVDGEVIDLEYHLSTSSFPSLNRLYLEGSIEKIPQWTPSLVGLTELYLKKSRLGRDQDPLGRIQGLINLRYLRMDLAYEGEGLIFRTEGFQRLKRLSLIRLENLRWVKVEEGCMPNLQELQVGACKLMAEEPEGLQHLLHLQSVGFSYMSAAFVNRVVEQRRRGNESELGHVPKVIIFSWVSDEQTGRWSFKRDTY